MKKMAEIRALSEEELRRKMEEARQELFHLRIQKRTGGVEKPSRFRELRRLLARVQTVLHEQRRGTSPSGAKP
jgi:large subunit ribosomal protein L29